MTFKGVDAKAYGVNVLGTIGNFRNISSNSFIVYSEGANATAYGVNATRVDSFENLGRFEVVANATEGFGQAYGIYANSIANFTNSRNYTVTALGTNNVRVVGVYTNQLTGNLFNHGTINILASISNSIGRANATGIYVIGPSEGVASVINNGTISVKVSAPQNANPSNIEIAAIRIGGGNVEISNYGIINIESPVVGANARTLWIDGGNVTLKDKFAITFGMPGINPEMRPIYVGSGVTLNLNNATLIARIDSRNLRYNTPYYLIQNNGTVIGVWGGLERGYTNPNILVRWGDPNQLGANSSVIFEYSAGASPENALASVISATVGTNIVVSSLITGIQYYSPLFGFVMSENKDKPIMLATAGMSEVVLLNPREKSYMYLLPVYTKVKASDLGFDADSYGFALGLGGMFSDRFGAEFFGGYVYNDIDFSVETADREKQRVFMGGISALYRIKPWFVRVSALGYTGKHDYRGNAGPNLNLRERAEYDSRGYRVDLTGGYVLGGAKVSVIPQLGLRYSYTKVDSYLTKVEGNPNLNRRIKPDSLDVWKVVGGVDLDAEIERKRNWNMRFIGGVFIEEALGKNEVSAVIYAPDKQRVKRDLADTTLSLNAGLSINYKRNWNFMLSGKGDFNGDYSAYTGSVMLRYNF
ncbi:MAG: autotransporter outer membrane beta-barrel domain-containing protein [Archaeoglobaceae archaeon]